MQNEDAEDPEEEDDGFVFDADTETLDPLQLPREIYDIFQLLFKRSQADMYTSPCSRAVEEGPVHRKAAADPKLQRREGDLCPLPRQESPRTRRTA